MKNKLFGISLSLFLTSTILLMTPKTNAKFFVENFGVAWENYFTAFTQLKDVFIITNDNVADDIHDEDKLWGTTDIDATGVFGNNTELQNNGGIYAYGEVNNQGFSDDKYVSKDTFNTAFSEYLIENLKGIEINVVNQSNEPVIINFEVHYYGPKLTNDTGTHFSFELYNTIEHPNGKTETIDGKLYNYALQGEFLVNIGEDEYTQGNQNNIVDIPVVRNSSSSGGEVATEDNKIFGIHVSYGGWYYPHRADINPYHILYNDGTGNKYQPHHEYYVNSQKYFSAYTNGKNKTGSPVAYRYPVLDTIWSGSNQSTQKTANELMPAVNINDFILEPSEAGSFNLSLYYGAPGSTTSGNGSFVTALCLNVETLDKVKSDYNALVTLHNNGYNVS